MNLTYSLKLQLNPLIYENCKLEEVFLLVFYYFIVNLLPYKLKDWDNNKQHNIFF
jgi:hypothetical protein